MVVVVMVDGGDGEDDDYLILLNDNDKIKSPCFLAKCVLRKYLLQNERSHKLQ